MKFSTYGGKEVRASADLPPLIGNAHTRAERSNSMLRGCPEERTGSGFRFGRNRAAKQGPDE